MSIRLVRFNKFEIVSRGIYQVAFCVQPVIFLVRYNSISKQNQGYLANEDIRAKEVRVIGSDGEMLGVFSLSAALKAAEDDGLDLVEISPTAVPPVCKIMDFGKFKFEQLKKEKENRKNQKTVEIKEVWLSMTIDVGDLKVKAGQAIKFIEAGNKVKASIRMKGRQMAHANMGVDVMNRFFALFDGKAVMEKPPVTEGRSIYMILAPAKN